MTEILGNSKSQLLLPIWLVKTICQSDESNQVIQSNLNEIWEIIDSFKKSEMEINDQNILSAIYVTHTFHHILAPQDLLTRIDTLLTSQKEKITE